MLEKREIRVLLFSRPDSVHFYKTGHKILRQLCRLGVNHNDLAKPQNWLMTPDDGDASLIDFQLASDNKKRGFLYRYFAYEDFRHLIKKKQLCTIFADINKMAHFTQSSMAIRFVAGSGKKVYNFVTKGLFNLLRLIALNELDELEEMLVRTPELRNII